MDRFEALEDIAAQEDILVVTTHIPRNLRGCYVAPDDKQAVIALSDALESEERLPVMAEEVGHHFTSSGNLCRVCSHEYERQEYRARGWGYRCVLPLDQIGDAYVACDANAPSMSEYLSVPASYLENAISYYRGKHGVSHSTERFNYRFEPYFVVTKKSYRKG